MKRFLLLLFLCTVGTAAKVCAADNLLSNGDFESLGNDWEDFRYSAMCTITEDAGKHYLTLTTQDLTQSAGVKQSVKVQEGQWLELTGKIRVKTLTTDGKAKWHNARVQTTWKDIDGKVLTVWPPTPNHDFPTPDWAEFQEFMKVPAQAATIIVAPSICYSKGEADFDDLVLKIVPESDVPDNIRARVR